MVRRFLCIGIGAFLCLPVLAGAADEDLPAMGLIAASAGEEVVIVDPIVGKSLSITAGPVAWLFPAPGGILFAPDLVNGKTTVVDLRKLVVKETIDGVTMPHFGERTDRYLVVSRQLLVMSYPERALMNRFELNFERPWQVEILAENTVLFVLERLPDGQGSATLTAANLSDGRLVYKTELKGDVPHFAVSPSLGLMALAGASSGTVVLAEPSTLLPVTSFPVRGRPVDVAFADHGSTLLVAVELPDGGGELVIWKLKSEKKKGLSIKKEWVVKLEGRPIRLAGSPDGRHVAVGLASPGLQIIDVGKKETSRVVELPAAPRDVRWCDPAKSGPLLPDWSDDDPPTLNIGGG